MDKGRDGSKFGGSGSDGKRFQSRTGGGKAAKASSISVPVSGGAVKSGLELGVIELFLF